jgi:AmiR/NasT family two-component response regulator
MPDPHPRIVLALVRDLIFASKISASARAAKVECKILRDPRQLNAQSGDLLIVDLNEPGAIEAAAQWQQASSRPVVGFVSHVDTERIERARAAGLTRVMARSGFVEALPTLMAQAPPAGQ